MLSSKEVYKGYKDKERVRKYRRDWARNWRKNNLKRSRENHRNAYEENPQHYRDYANNWYQNNVIKERKRSREINVQRPEVLKAHNESQKFPLGLKCELCPEGEERTNDLEKHHPDYNYPEIFVTVCSICHGIQRRID
jgi:hypothetical protein